MPDNALAAKFAAAAEKDLAEVSISGNEHRFKVGVLRALLAIYHTTASSEEQR